MLSIVKIPLLQQFLLLQPLDDYDSDVDEPDPDTFYRIINTPIPDFSIYFHNYMRNPLKLVQKKTWMKVGAVSVAAIATAAGLATMSGGGVWHSP